MHLDVGISPKENPDDDYNDPEDPFMPYIDESLDDFENVLNQYLEDDNNNETLNFNGDVSKITINDILNEMRMGSPIQNDIVTDLLNDECNNNFHQYFNGDLVGSIDQNDCYDKSFSQNNVSKEENVEHIANDNDLLEQLLNSDACSTPDVQFEFNDGVEFQFDSKEQFNCEPDITLFDPKESDNTKFQDNSGMSFDFNMINNEDLNNQIDFDIESYLKDPEPDSTKQYFECSTCLPMTPEELQDDIQKYVNNEQNYSYTSYEYADMINDPTDKQSDNQFEFPYSSDMLQEYISEQNLLFESLDTVNPIVAFETPKIESPEEKQSNQKYQCNICSFYTTSFQGFSLHMCVHSGTPLRCTDCNFTTKNEYNLKQHQAYSHGTTYCCQMCNFTTASSAQIKWHVRKEH